MDDQPLGLRPPGRDSGVHGLRPGAGGGRHGPEAGRHLLRGGAQCRVLGKAGGDEIPQVRRYGREVGLLMNNGVQHRRNRSAVEGWPARAGQGQGGTEREHVSGGAGISALDLFGGHEGGGADEGAGVGDPGRVVDGPRDAEVDDPDAVLGEEDVRRLQVPVDEPGPVDVGQRPCEPGGEPPHRLLRQHANHLQGLTQSGSGQEQGGEPGRGGVRVGIDHRRRIGPGNPPGGVHLAPKPGAEALVLGEVGVHAFDGDEAPVPGRRQQDPAHAALAEHGDRPERPHLRRIVRPQCLHVELSPAWMTRTST
ncbi:hypothetical protein A3Q37_05642 [Streptomyces sp. PTY087I2]|nr:hypothetical protein A3Q37_05642 [Streptomyces sp. PTY087I2]